MAHDSKLHPGALAAAALALLFSSAAAEAAAATSPLPRATAASFAPVDTFTLDDGRKVETVELPGLKCFQPNTQFPAEDPADERFGGGEWGNHEFVLALPAGYSGGPVPLFLHLRGGGFGWVDTTVPVERIPKDLLGVAWTEEGRAPGFHYNFPLLSVQWWTRRHAYSSLTFEPLPELPGQRGNPNTFISQLRARFPAWAILYPSYCSRDAYFGRGEPGLDGTRYGYLALLHSLDYVADKYGVEHLFVGGTSAGGLGAAVIARDLDRDRPELELLGAIVDSGPAEGRAYARVKDEGVVDGLRRIALDDGTRAWIACDHPLQSVERGIEAIGFMDFSMKAAIENGDIDVPIFHAWQSRDNVTMCGDLEFSNRYMDGAIARALDKHNPGGASVNYEKCEGTTPACATDEPTTADSCAPDKLVQVPCSRHGVVGGGPNVVDALQWMEDRVAARASRRPAATSP